MIGFITQKKSIQLHVQILLKMMDQKYPSSLLFRKLELANRL